MTQREDLDARELAHAVLEYLIGFGECHVLEADIVDREDLVARVNGAASVGDAGRLDALDQNLVLAVHGRLGHGQLDSDGRTGRLFDFDKQRST